MMSLLFQLSLFLMSIVYVHCKDCLSLDGVWYNQLGSEMILNHTIDGELYGQYRTTVERETGSHGLGHANLIGAAPYNTPGTTVGFAVMFNGGVSITAWTGQCLVCEGEEVLVSSWLLRERVNTCTEKWKSTRIGQDLFIRRKQANTEITYGPGYNTINPAGVSSVHVLKRAAAAIPCGLQGAWYNEMGSEVILHHGPNNYITGEYRTAVEISRGSAGISHSKIYGLGSVHDSETTFALFVVWRNGASVTGWVGQCHLCGPNKAEVLEVNWLLRSGVDHCEDNWKATNYGQNSFTRHEQKQGPRKYLRIHTPQQDGEDDLEPDLHKQLTCSSCRHYITPFASMISLVLLCVIL